MPITEAEYYEAISNLPKTSAGLDEKLRLLEHVVWDEEKPQSENGETENVQYKKRKTRVENYYYGVPEEYLSLWITLRSVGLVLGRGWIGGRVSVQTLTLAAPLCCQPMPPEYDGKRGDGLW